MNEQNNIRVLFTPKANSALDNIVMGFKLEETPAEAVKRGKEKKISKIAVIDQFAKDFAKGTISEKDLINSLQKNLEVSQKIAEQISKEVITKIVPFLEKVPEEKLKDPAFVEEISKKIFGETAAEVKETKIGKKLPGPAAPTVSRPEEKIKNKITQLEKSIKKPAVQEKIKQFMPPPKQPSGPDSYREPIE